jgi:hypothetical protein
MSSLVVDSVAKALVGIHEEDTTYARMMKRLGTEGSASHLAGPRVVLRVDQCVSLVDY